MPDARVARPHRRRVICRARRAHVVELERRTVLQRRRTHPDERLARRIPRVDLVRDDVALGVREAQAVSALAAVRVREALDSLREPDQERRSVDRRRAEAAHREDDAPLEHAERTLA